MPPSSSAPASKHKHGAHVLASLAVINLEVVVVVVVVVVPIPANLKVNSAPAKCHNHIPQGDEDAKTSL